MAGFRSVHQLEGLHLMLHDVGKYEKTPFGGSYLTDLLGTWTISCNVEEIAYAVVVILFKVAFHKTIRGDFCAKGKVRVGDVLVVVIVS